MADLHTIDAIVIGASYGGMESLAEIFRNLSVHFSLPVVIVYHRAKKSDGVFLLDYFSGYTKQTIIEVADNETIHPQHIYLAPADYHILIENKKSISLSVDEPVNHSRPSIDILFQSASFVYQDKVMGIILSGASSDGTDGLCAISRAGGFTIAQDPAQSISPRMPQSAIEKCKINEIANLKRIAELMNLADSYQRNSI